jgi:hypothetical protein
MQVVRATARSTAPPRAVWDVVADAPGWSRWGGWKEARIEREGDPPPGGLGAIKVLVSERRPSVTSREEVTVFDPPTRFGYRLLSGLPLRDYEASITLADAAEGVTEITWRSQFEPKIPLTGSFFRRILQTFMEDAVQSLAREAERQD